MRDVVATPYGIALAKSLQGAKRGELVAVGGGRKRFKTYYTYTLKPEYEKHFVRTKKIDRLVGKGCFTFTPDKVSPQGAAMIDDTVIAFPNERIMFVEKLDINKVPII